MGEFKAGTWIILLSMYFFLLFLIVYSSVNAAAALDVDSGDAQFRDPGFLTAENDPSGRGLTCSGISSHLCTRISGETDCLSIDGCSFVSGLCVGRHTLECYNLSDYAGVGFYENLTVNDMCSILESDCTLASYTGSFQNSVDPSKAFDWSTVRNSLGIMTGISATGVNIGMPGAFRFIFYFLFFWIPLFALVYSVYMALPFLH